MRIKRIISDSDFLSKTEQNLCKGLCLVKIEVKANKLPGIVHKMYTVIHFFETIVGAVSLSPAVKGRRYFSDTTLGIIFRHKLCLIKVCAPALQKQNGHGIYI